MKYYSQVGQDRWVCRNTFFKKDGFFLDLGAGDGRYISNSYVLEMELGWDGICVEADVSKCIEMMSNRECHQIHGAVYSKDGYVRFATSNKNGIWGVKDTLQEDSGDDMVTVASYTIKSILEIFNAPTYIDYVSIDVEGADYEALLGFPFDTHEVGLWTIEHNAYLDGGVLKGKIRELMLSKGYLFVPEEQQSEYVVIFEDWWYNPKYITLC